MLVKRENRAAVRREELQAYELVTTIVADELRALVRSPRNTVYDLFQCIAHVQRVLAFANTQLVQTSACYGNCVVQMFGAQLSREPPISRQLSMRNLVGRRARERRERT